MCLCHQAVLFGTGQRTIIAYTAGKVIVGLASHWPCVTYFSGLSTYGLKLSAQWLYRTETSTPPTIL